MKSTRWFEITPSQFAWEREALDDIKARLPERATPLLAVVQENLPWLKHWHNEVDLLVVSTHKVYLVEIKSWSGVISGDASTWRREKDGNAFLVDNPLLLANRKAKKLISLLQTQKALAKQRRPFVEAVAFLSRSGVRCRLEGRARTGVYLSAESERDGHRNILDVLSGTAGFDPRRLPPRIDRLRSRAFARAMRMKRGSIRQSPEVRTPDARETYSGESNGRVDGRRRGNGAHHSRAACRGTCHRGEKRRKRGRHRSTLSGSVDESLSGGTCRGPTGGYFRCRTARRSSVAARHESMRRSPVSSAGLAALAHQERRYRTVRRACTNRRPGRHGPSHA